jgi:hypothetical protein
MRKTSFPPVLIGTGLAILLGSAFWQSAPVVTGMAIIALGSTDLMVARCRNSVTAFPILVLHGMTYVLLYSLFLSARLHLPTAALSSSVSNLSMLDLAVSAFPMALALSRIFNCLRAQALSRQ